MSWTRGFQNEIHARKLMHHIGTTRASLVAPLTSMSSEGRWLLRGSIRRAAWMESDCMDGGMDGRVRHAYPVLYGVQYRYMRCTGSSGRGGARRFHVSIVIRFATHCLMLGTPESGLGTGFTMMFTTAGHTRYTARHHSVGSGCGHLGSGRVQTPSEGEIHAGCG